MKHPACCSHHGVCIAGQCQCESSWGGKSCEVPLCPGNCSDNGRCFQFPASDGKPFGFAECACFEGWGGPDCTLRTCEDSCSANGVCINGSCACFKGYEGKSCESRLYTTQCMCGDRCADYCLGQCKSTLDVEGMDVGRQCFVGCSKQCFARCVGGRYELPDNVGKCESPQCKMMKRTVLDIDGVLSHESNMPRPDALFGGKYLSPPAKPEPVEDLPEDVRSAVLSNLPAKLDLNQIASGVELSPIEIEEMISGNGDSSDGRKKRNQAFAENVMVQLSPEDREALKNLH